MGGWQVRLRFAELVAGEGEGVAAQERHSCCPSSKLADLHLRVELLDGASPPSAHRRYSQQTKSPPNNRRPAPFPHDANRDLDNPTLAPISPPSLLLNPLFHPFPLPHPHHRLPRHRINDPKSIRPQLHPTVPSTHHHQHVPHAHRLQQM